MRALKMKTRATRKGGGSFFFCCEEETIDRERNFFLSEKKTEREELHQRNFAFFLNFVFVFLGGKVE